MILGTLGSNKLVTTTNAILTEVFTGIKPYKILILSEDKPERDYTKISDILKLFGINSSVSVEVMGEGIKEWKDKLSSIKMDVIDITPGRKYMALATYVYSNSQEIRYVYLKEESEGYRVFGYVPFHDLVVYNVRSGEIINFDPPKTVTGDKEAKITIDGLRALLNLYLLLSDKVELEVKGDISTGITISKNGVDIDETLYDKNAMETCLLRSGFLRFKQEDEIKRWAMDRDTKFLADTNVYINLGDRVGWLTKGKVLPSSSTYYELDNMLKTTQKNDVKLYLANLGMDSYKRIHKWVPNEKSSGSDLRLINEALTLKSYYPEVILITGDTGVYNSARQKIRVILLKDKERGKGAIEYLVECLRYFSDIDISVNGQVYSVIKREKAYGEEKIKIVNMKKEYNYPYFISLVEAFLYEM
ncbi:hypothetical protein [Sulfurisphaera ohwakuensis]|uniref:Uncharacterized protein n=1 Tax=Sulfurisphaera ohwakuensis TaxID=69656 RepID=A0A650CGK3_SULOH|nr:hypothetical protein [Sulfurisphaera ohwakuensis]MBB5252672.1 hypothetical protein [Sulfurisphaera ohwakuensis]QGR16899.1 hypothetical protein D1869_06700 [Sulfurisphaera ohwakuensis]